MVDVFQLIGKFVIQNQEANDGIDETTDKAESAKEKFSNAFGKIGSVAVAAGKVIAAGLAAGSAAVGAIAKASLDSFAEYEQLVGGSQLLYGDAYDFIADKAANAYSTVQMSQKEYLQQVNGFATGLKTALGGNEQAAAELADRIITAEADIVAATGNSQEAVQNAFNGIMKSNFTMLDNLQLGITPTKEGFQEVIDKVNEWNTANGNATAYQIDNLADCQSALLDYVEMQGLAGYAADEAAGTIQGSLNMVKASWQNLLTGFADGEQDLNVLVDNLVTSVTTAAQLIVPKLGQILGGISTALSEIIPVISAELPALLEQLLPGVVSGAVSLINGLILALPSILQILIEQFPSIMVQIGEALASCFPVLLETVQNLFGQIFDYISLELLNTGFSFEDMTTKAKEVFNSLWTEAQAVWESIGLPIWNMIQSCIETVRNVFSEKMPEIKDFVSTCFADIGSFWENNLKPCFEAIGNFIETVLAPIFDFVFAVLIGGTVQTVFDGIKALWENTLKPVFTGITDFLTGIFTLDFGQALDGILGIATGVFNGIILAVQEPFDWAKNFINEALEYIKGLFDFEWSLPQLALPHFSVSGGEAPWGFGGKGSLPSVGIEWYAKGAVLNDATAFGINPFTGNAMVGGEAGAEAVAPISTLQQYVKAAVQDENNAMIQHLERIIDMLSQFFPDALDAMRTPMVCDTNGLAVAMAPTMNRELGRIAIKKGRGR